MTKWRLNNKWCKRCPYKKENVDSVQRELESLQKAYDELKFRYGLALEHVEELANRLRRHADS